MAGLIEACLPSWNMRSYVHWAIGAGLEEGEASPVSAKDALGPILSGDSALPRLRDTAPDGVAASAVGGGTGEQAFFLTLSRKTADRFEESCSAPAKCVTEEVFQAYSKDEVEDDVLDGSAYPVLIAGPSDIVGSPEQPFVTKLREKNPNSPFCVVLLDQDLDAFKHNLWLVTVLSCLVENADMVVFAT